MTKTDGRILHFGEFQFDPQRLTLSKGSTLVPLKRQSAEVLALLLEAPGQTITREHIRNHIWHDRTIEFDHGINAAIRDIRSVLSDDSKSPQFIETHPKVGYRFLAPVRQPDRDFFMLRLRALAAVGIVTIGAVVVGMAMSFDLDRSVAVAQPRLAVMPVRNTEIDNGPSTTADEWTNSMVRQLAESQQRARIVSAGELFGVDHPDPSMADMSRWLEVDYLLAGTLERIDGEQNLNLRLVQTDGYVHIWAKTVPLEEDDRSTFRPLIGEIVAAIDGADS